MQILGAMESLPHQKRSLQILQSASRTLISLLEEVLDYSRPEFGNVSLDEKPLMLRKCLEELLLVPTQPAQERA